MSAFMMMPHMLPIQIAFDPFLFASMEHKPILADRFKTKMCHNFERTGVCPYEFRCMFAHGERDLRTKTQNVADNLFSEEAIKQFQRARMEAEEQKEQLSIEVGSNTPSSHFMTPSLRPSTPTSPSSCYCDDCMPVVRRSGTYRHDPYKIDVLTLAASSYASTPMCDSVMLP